MKQKLKYVSETAESFFYLTFYGMMSIVCISLALLIPMALILNAETFIKITNKLFYILDTYRFWMIVLFIFAGLFSVGRVVIDHYKK